MMYRQIFTFGLLASILILFVPGYLFGQSPIHGNKNIVQDTRSLKLFTKLKVELNGEVIVHVGHQPKVIVETDQNILKYVKTTVTKNELLITQKAWPEPSTKYVIHVYTPMLTKIVSDSWVNIIMKDIKQEILRLQIEQGTVTASGNVKELYLKSEQGNFNLENLVVNFAELKMSGYGDVKICCVEELKKHLGEGATLQIMNEPNPTDPLREAKQKLKYLNFEIVNNSWSRNHFVVRGPKGHRFSYGFPMLPGFSKKERWPVGTKVYKTNLLGLERLLLEVSEDDEGARLLLFQDGEEE